MPIPLILWGIGALALAGGGLAAYFKGAADADQTIINNPGSGTIIVPEQGETYPPDNNWSGQVGTATKDIGTLLVIGVLAYLLIKNK